MKIAFRSSAAEGRCTKNATKIPTVRPARPTADTASPRLDAVIPFASLTPETIGRVVDKFILQLEEQLADRNVTIELDAPARKWLGAKGYDKLFGARPLARIIQEHVKKPLAEELLFGKLVKGGVVHVQVKDDKLVFSFEEAPPQPSRKEPEFVE